MGNERTGAKAEESDDFVLDEDDPSKTSYDDYSDMDYQLDPSDSPNAFDGSNRGPWGEVEMEKVTPKS